MMKKIIFFLFFGALYWGANAQLNPGATTTSWQITGNMLVTDTNFLGTLGCKSLIFKTKNKERMRLLHDYSYLGIGINGPQASLHLHHQNIDQDLCGENGNGGNNRDDEDSTNVRGTVRSLLRLTTPETGIQSDRGFSVSYNNKDITFSQFEQGKFFIKGPGGGLTITPDGKIGMGTDAPQAKLDVNGGLRVWHTATANYQEASKIDVNSIHTKALVVFNRATNAGVFTVYGNGTVNAKKIYAEAITVTLSTTGNPWYDHVFYPDYNLRPLPELEQFIKENHHLPEIPSAEEVKENGIDLGEMQAKLLLKVEELTLYILSLQRQIDELKQMKGGE